jgi:hypothetical protein
MNWMITYLFKASKIYLYEKSYNGNKKKKVIHGVIKLDTSKTF